VTPTRRVVFVMNLLQDVSVLRPLIIVSARDLDLRVEVMVTGYFSGLDQTGAWREEIAEIAAEAGVPVVDVADERATLRFLQSGGGVLIAGSESGVDAHAVTHALFECAPPSFVTITLQHGFECLGFLHNRAHDRRYGPTTFAADVVCGWFDGSRLTSMEPSQRPKLYVSGPPFLLQSAPSDRSTRRDVGLVCENLHSVRFTQDGETRTEFISVFRDFCNALGADHRGVQLRPHPAGQFVIKNEVDLPSNVTINNNPIYKVDLAQFAYGISAPSSILLDLMLAGVPVAVWKDGRGGIDAGNYQGLTEVSTVGEWLEFSRDAVARPEHYRERQRAFIDGLMIQTDPGIIHARFMALIDSAARSSIAKEPVRGDPDRILFVANTMLATLQICFMRPLAPLATGGKAVLDVVTEEQMRKECGDLRDDQAALEWIDRRMAAFKPTKLVFCRYSGPHAPHFAARARAVGADVVFHIDDDLLNVPVVLGRRKFEYHNQPERKRTIRWLLSHSDLVYCSTEHLKKQLLSLGATAPLVAGKINCAGSVIVPAVNRPVRKLGYMASGDHAPNLAMVAPVIVDIMRRYPDLQFGLFGLIAKPAEFDVFGDRVSTSGKIEDYDEFLRAFAKSDWDIGICPLVPTPFNKCKGNNKWIEYTSIGAAVVASAETVYDTCCADGCGALVKTADEWRSALERLITDPDERYAQVLRAQQKLRSEYSDRQLQEQVIDILGLDHADHGNLRVA